MKQRKSKTKNTKANVALPDSSTQEGGATPLPEPSAIVVEGAVAVAPETIQPANDAHNTPEAIDGAKLWLK